MKVSGSFRVQVRNYPLPFLFFSSTFAPPISLLAPAMVTPGENTTTEVEEDKFRYFQSACPAFSQTVMIEQIDIIGKCSLYASASVQNPGRCGLFQGWPPSRSQWACPCCNEEFYDTLSCDDHVTFLRSPEFP